MAEGLTFINQFNLVNAPAGSGKTTAVSISINNLLMNPIKRILCITYTNRAAEQLAMKIDDERVDISTIHSFIGRLLNPFFKIKSIINFFGDFYDERIEAILNSKEENDKERIQKYKINFGLDDDFKVTKEIILSNISHLRYGETPFTSYLYGKLSHDDLLIFSKELFEKFPKLKKIISQRYSYVFIDEYQDTKSEILALFYNAILGSDTKLILLGDEMQQIYKDRVEGFQRILDEKFVQENSLITNWRSQKNIVKILNNLYFDSLYKQTAKKEEGIKPTIYIVNEMEKVKVENNTLQLVLYNRDLFSEIGASNLFDAYNHRYKIFDKYNTKEILSNMDFDNPDDLIILLIFITEISMLFDNNQYSMLIQKIMSFKFANKELWLIKNHADKIKIRQYISDLSNRIKEDISIEMLLDFLRENDIIDTSYIDAVQENIDRQPKFKEKIYTVKLIEFLKCYNEMKNPNLSTQHAVKGEGYDSVALKISDGSNPNVKMYMFLNMFSKDTFNYRELNYMNNEIKSYIKTFSYSIGMNIAALKAPDFTRYIAQCKDIIRNIKETLTNNQYLYTEFFYKEFDAFDTKASITTFNKCIKSIKRIEGVLLAYKLFYVGCSRAKEKLDVYVKYDSIQEFEEKFISKMETIEFEVVKLNEL